LQFLCDVNELNELRIDKTYSEQAEFFICFTLGILLFIDDFLGMSLKRDDDLHGLSGHFEVGEFPLKVR
jgi:hypothetical protein